MQKNIDIIEELNVADSVIRQAFSDNLAAEVFVFAMKAMKENPNLSISEAIYMGYDEWIK
jgi:hypothetical protein